MSNNAEQNSQDLPLVLTVADVASILGIGRHAAYTLIASGKLPCIRVGRLIRVSRDSLMRYLQQS